jgi:hypothetical protein
VAELLKASETFESESLMGLLASCTLFFKTGKNQLVIQREMFHMSPVFLLFERFRIGCQTSYVGAIPLPP